MLGHIAKCSVFLNCIIFITHLCVNIIIITNGVASLDIKSLPNPTSCEKPYLPSENAGKTKSPTAKEEGRKTRRGIKTMPSLPNRYNYVIEVKSLQDEGTYEITETRDGDKQDTELYVNGKGVNTIFNPDPLERYDIYDQDEPCVVRRGGPDNNPFSFIGLDTIKPNGLKGPFSYILELGVEFDTTASFDQTTLRGTPVNHWNLCLEWKESKAKLQIDYFYSPPDFQTAWGKVESPQRVVLQGTTGTLDKGKGDKEPYEFHQIYDFISYIKDPYVGGDEFQIPKNVVCKERTGNKRMPTLPDNLQMDVKLSHPLIGNTVLMQTSLRYDWDSQITETVRELPTSHGFSRDQTVSSSDINIVRTFHWINDYHTGLQYITEKENDQSCSVLPMPQSSTSMIHGNALLRMSGDTKRGSTEFKYQGITVYRGLDVESWGVDSDGLVQKIFFLKRSSEENDGFAQFPVLVGILLRNKIEKNMEYLPTLTKEIILSGTSGGGDLSWTHELDMADAKTPEMELSVYHYQPLHTDPHMFHVSQCYSTAQKSRVLLTVQSSYSKYIQPNPIAFAIAMRQALSKALFVSKIQISDLELHRNIDPKNDDDLTIVTFNLLGSPPIKEIKNKQPDILELKQRLQESIRQGISFVVSNTNNQKRFAVDKNIYAFDSGDNDFSVLEKYGRKNHLMFGVSNVHSSGGHSPGLVAGVSIACMVLTCAVTVVVVYVYLKIRRKRSDQFPCVPYTAPDNQSVDS